MLPKDVAQLTIIRPPLVRSISAVPAIHCVPLPMPQAVYRGVAGRDPLMGVPLRRGTDERVVFGGTSRVVQSSVRRHRVLIRHVLEVLEYVDAAAHADLEGLR